jgi:hypothetical protein
MYLRDTSPKATDFFGKTAVMRVSKPDYCNPMLDAGCLMLDSSRD